MAGKRDRPGGSKCVGWGKVSVPPQHARDPQSPAVEMKRGTSFFPLGTTFYSHKGGGEDATRREKKKKGIVWRVYGVGSDGRAVLRTRRNYCSSTNVRTVQIL